MDRIRVLYYEYPGVGVGGSRNSLANLIAGLGERVCAYVVGNLPDEVGRRLPDSSGTDYGTIPVSVYLLILTRWRC